MSSSSNPVRSLALRGTVRDLVRLFKVTSPSTIANWRTRYDDFPNPRTGRMSSSVVFDLDEVLAWARRGDTPAKLRHDPGWWWDRTVDALYRQTGAPARADGRMRDYLASFVLLHAA